MHQPHVYIVELEQGIDYEGTTSTIQLVTLCEAEAQAKAAHIKATHYVGYYDYCYVTVSRAELGHSGQPERLLSEEVVNGITYYPHEIDVTTGVHIPTDAASRGNSVHEFMLYTEVSAQTRRRLSHQFGSLTYEELQTLI